MTDDADLEHIADLVRQGFTEGEICVTVEPAARSPGGSAAVVRED